MLVACDGQQLLDRFALIGACLQVALADAAAPFEQLVEEAVQNTRGNFVFRAQPRHDLAPTHHEVIREEGIAVFGDELAEAFGDRGFALIQIPLLLLQGLPFGL